MVCLGSMASLLVHPVSETKTYNGETIVVGWLVTNNKYFYDLFYFPSIFEFILQYQVLKGLRTRFCNIG